MRTLYSFYMSPLTAFLIFLNGIMIGIIVGSIT